MVLTNREKGLWCTPHYRAQAIAWGLVSTALPGRLRAWLLTSALGGLPGLRTPVPTVAHLWLGDAGDASPIGL